MLLEVDRQVHHYPVIRMVEPERLNWRLIREVVHVRVLVVPLKTSVDERPVQRHVLMPVSENHGVVLAPNRGIPRLFPLVAASDRANGTDNPIAAAERWEEHTS